MAHTLIKPTVIAKQALAVLYNATVFAQLVYRDFDSEFTGKQGDTVNIRTPGTFTAKTFVRSTGIELQEVTETSIPVVLDTIADVSFAITTEDLTLTIDNFRERFLAPAMEAHAQRIDAELAEALVDAAEVSGGGGTATWTSSKPSSVFTGETGAVARLGRKNAPLATRYAVFSPEGAGVALSEELFVAADKSGWTDALRRAALGQVFGFETYQSNALGYGPGDAGQADGVAFHRDAVALTSRTLVPPDGLPPAQYAVENYKGLGLRVTKAYDINKKQDVISVDFLYTVDTIRKQWAVQLNVGLGS
jgi:P22 coat protein - gene protein 5